MSFIYFLTLNAKVSDVIHILLDIKGQGHSDVIRILLDIKCQGHSDVIHIIIDIRGQGDFILILDTLSCLNTYTPC
jgi:hypothetical protein